MTVSVMQVPALGSITAEQPTEQGYRNLYADEGG